MLGHFTWVLGGKFTSPCCKASPSHIPSLKPPLLSTLPARILGSPQSSSPHWNPHLLLLIFDFYVISCYQPHHLVLPISPPSFFWGPHIPSSLRLCISPKTFQEFFIALNAQPWTHLSLSPTLHPFLPQTLCQESLSIVASPVRCHILGLEDSSVSEMFACKPEGLCPVA